MTSHFTEVLSLEQWRKLHGGTSGKSRRSTRKAGRQEKRADRRDDRQDRKTGRQMDRADNKADRADNKADRQGRRADRKADRQERRATYGEEDFGGETDLGPNVKVTTRPGFRAAFSQIKPGLFLVAEVPETAMEGDFGSLLLTSALGAQLRRVFQRDQAGRQGAGVVQQQPTPQPLALPGPTPVDDGVPYVRMPDGSVRKRTIYTMDYPVVPAPGAPQPVKRRPIFRWLDADLAGELGCRCEEE